MMSYIHVFTESALGLLVIAEYLTHMWRYLNAKTAFDIESLTHMLQPLNLGPSSSPRNAIFNINAAMRIVWHIPHMMSYMSI